MLLFVSMKIYLNTFMIQCRWLYANNIILYTDERIVRLRPVSSPLGCSVCFQHRPIRHCRYGYDGFDLTTAASCNRTAAPRSGYQACSRVRSSRGHCTIHQRTWTRRLLTRWLLKPESKPISWKEFLHCPLNYVPLVSNVHDLFS